MSNVMYLVCTHHPERVHSFRLAIRGTKTQYVSSGIRRQLADKLEEWLEEHRDCGGGFDHFTLAFDQPKDHDASAPPDKIANGVHAALHLVDTTSKGN